MTVTRALSFLTLASAPAAAVIASTLVLGYWQPDGITPDGGSPDIAIPPDSPISEAGTCNPMTGPGCSGNGTPGCAGYGGSGGTGGQGGGAAIALFVTGNSDVTMIHGGLFTGNGGNGGSGGSGAPGGIGQNGDAGQPAFCYAGCDPSAGCTPIGPTVIFEGGVGGTGNNGAAGGQGGGGAGGSTYFYAVYGDASVNIPAEVLSASQTKGLAGAGGAPNGPDGGFAPSITVP